MKHSSERLNSNPLPPFFLFLSPYQMQRGQQGIASGVAQPHHDSVRRHGEVVSGPARGPDGEYSCHRVQHSDPERGCPRRGTLRLLHPHQQEAEIHQGSSHRPRYHAPHLSISVKSLYSIGLM